MHRRVTFLAVFAIGGLCLSVAAAPRTAETPTDKRVKEFVAKVLTVLGKHDFDAYVKCCDVPFLVQPSSPGTSGILTDKEGFKTDIERRYEGKPTFDGRNHVVRSIHSLREAKGRFTKEQTADAEAVLTDDGLVVHVEFNGYPRSTHHRLLIREKDGQFRLVGMQPAGEDE